MSTFVIGTRSTTWGLGVQLCQVYRQNIETEAIGHSSAPKLPVTIRTRAKTEGNV
jgi:hypothetical protein